MGGRITKCQINYNSFFGYNWERKSCITSDQETRSSNPSPDSYYVLTTIHVRGLPRFAAFCLFCDKFNNPKGIYIPGKSRQNRAK